MYLCTWAVSISVCAFLPFLFQPANDISLHLKLLGMREGLMVCSMCASLQWDPFRDREK